MASRVRNQLGELSHQKVGSLTGMVMKRIDEPPDPVEGGGDPRAPGTAGSVPVTSGATAAPASRKATQLKIMNWLRGEQAVEVGDRDVEQLLQRVERELRQEPGLVAPAQRRPQPRRREDQQQRRAAGEQQRRAGAAARSPSHAESIMPMAMTLRTSTLRMSCQPSQRQAPRQRKETSTSARPPQMASRGRRGCQAPSFTESVRPKPATERTSTPRR